ncbi:hypothetical protein QF002_004668 [Paraburkholderia youngii]
MTMREACRDTLGRTGIAHPAKFVILVVHTLSRKPCVTPCWKPKPPLDWLHYSKI